MSPEPGRVVVDHVWKRFRKDRGRKLLRDQVSRLGHLARRTDADPWRWVLRDIGKDGGPKLQAVFEEVPAKASPRKLLSRGLELRDGRTLAVYLRNLERELTDEAELEDFEHLFEERLAALVEAN